MGMAAVWCRQSGALSSALHDGALLCRAKTAGVSAISLMDGSKVSIKDQTRANITKDNQDFCFDWLKQNGLDDIIKNDVVLTFGRGQDSDASNLIGELQDRGLYPSNKKTVPWNTLAKTVEEIISRRRLGRGSDAAGPRQEAKSEQR